MGDGRPDGQTRSREQLEDTGHEQPETGVNSVDTHNVSKTKTRNSADTSSKWLHQRI